MPGSSSSSCHPRSEEHTSELQSPCNLVCRLLLEKKKTPGIAPGTTPTLTTLAVDLQSRPYLLWEVSLSGRTQVYVRGYPYGFIGMIFFFNDTATTEIYTLSLHDALPISSALPAQPPGGPDRAGGAQASPRRDRKSTRLNSSHLVISYAVYCLTNQLR